MIRIENLVKNFGPKRAVDGISFNVEQGELYFLGRKSALGTRQKPDPKGRTPSPLMVAFL